MADPPGRILDFISEKQLAEIRKEHGETETIVPEKPLFEILKENKDKQQAEFNERFKHRPPKALDEDETDFLEKLEMSKKQHEKQLANEEAQQLLNFQAAISSKTFIPQESKIYLQQPNKVSCIGMISAKDFEKEKRPTPVRPLTKLVKIQPKLKRAKVKETTSVESQEKDVSSMTILSPSIRANEKEGNAGPLQGLVSYGSESDEEDD